MPGGKSTARVLRNFSWKSCRRHALRSVPLTGKLIRIPRLHDVRRVVLRTTRYQIYYRVERDTVTVLAI